MANEITNTVVTKDQEKYLSAQLLARTNLNLIAASICDKEPQLKGQGTTAYFVRYARMNVPVVSLTEGTDPTNSTFALEELTCTMDQWGDYLIITDVAELTAKHPLMQEALKLLSDNAQRVIDREVQVVWLAGTNVLYGGTATARSGLAAADTLTNTLIGKARVTLVDGGAAPRGGPHTDAKVGNAMSASSINGGKNYVAVAGPQVIQDIMGSSTSFGTFASVATYSNQKALYACEVGTWLNLRWVESNFIPKFTMLGNSTAAVASTGSGGITGLVVTAVDGGGTLTSGATYYWKVTRKDLLRGFEEAISIEHTTAAAATGNNESFTFALPSTSGYVYNVYFGSSTGDANLKLVSTGNHAASATVTVTAVSSSTTTAPVGPGVAAAVSVPTVHVIYVHGESSCGWVGLQNLEVIRSGDQATTSNPLKLRRTIGYKFMAKSLIKNQSFMVRIECAANY